METITETQPESKKFYTAKEVSKLLSVHVRTIYINIRKGKIPSVRAGGIRIPASFLFPETQKSSNP